MATLCCLTCADLRTAPPPLAALQNPPMAKNPRAMKNAEKLAASKKTPLVARYVHGKIAYVRAEAQ